MRIGGLVTTLEADGFRLDDGTSIGRVVLADAAASVLEHLRPGDALNATGVPERRDELVLVVGDAADIELAGDLGAGTAVIASVDAAPLAGAPSAAVDGDGPRASAGRGLRVDPAVAGTGTVALVILLSVLLAWGRRYRADRVVAAGSRRGSTRSPGAPPIPTRRRRTG